MIETLDFKKEQNKQIKSISQLLRQKKVKYFSKFLEVNRKKKIYIY